MLIIQDIKEKNFFIFFLCGKILFSVDLHR